MKALYSIAVLACVVALVAGCGASTPQPTSVAPTQPPSAAPTNAPAAAPTAAQPTADQTTAYPAPTAEPAAGYPAAEAPTAEPAVSYPAAESFTWAADGVIGPEEYMNTTTIGAVTVSWANDSQSLYLAAQAKTTGWLAVGIDPEDRMQGANFIIASFDGQARIVDAFGTAPVGAAHPADGTLGGKNDIAAYAVVEKDGVTTFEVELPLDSGDANDKVLKPGETYPIIVGVGASDDITAPHRFTGVGEITLSPAS